MQISIVIPALNEEDCIQRLLDEIAVIESVSPVGEVIVVDDGSTDETAARVLSMKGKVQGLRLIRHRERRGQSTAICTGVRSAQCSLIVTLDGDGQNNPADIPALHAAYEKAVAERGPRVMVCGHRLKRQDTAVRRLSSRIANTVRKSILDDGVSDTGCSLKLFRRDDFLGLPFFNHIHRFIPALMKASGVSVTVVDVSHRPRLQGTSKYGVWDRLWVGIHDLFGVSWLIRRMLQRVETEEQS